jgi:hypothetical protein
MPFKTHTPTIVSDESTTIVVQDFNTETVYHLDDENSTILIVQDKLVSYSDPDGPSSFDIWRQEGHPDGTFEEFLEYEKALQTPPSPGTDPSPILLETYTFVQNIADSQWTIKHNLNRYPSVTLVDTFGDKFEADQRYIDANTIQIKFIAPTAGTAFLN